MTAADARRDWFDDPEIQAWSARVLEEVVPMVSASAMSISLVPEEETDIKFAVELGLCIMMDKPILALVRPGTKVPERLVRVADRVVEFDPATATVADHARLADALAEMTGRPVGLRPPDGHA